MTQKKINLVELLKYCPKGMELDCRMFDIKVFYQGLNKRVSTPTHPIVVQTEHGFEFELTQYGQIHNIVGSKCVIFPKGKTTWEGFVPPCKFKDGDTIFTHANCLKVGVGNSWISIFKEKRNGGVATYVDYAEDGSDYYSDLDGDKALLCMESDILRQRLATEEEKAKLFDAIKANGYQWNAETKTLEKLVEPKFKVGDKIENKYGFTASITRVNDEYYNYANKDGQCGSISIKNQDDWELVSNKFNINTLKPFDRVLIRLTNDCVWMPKFFSHYDTGPNVKYYPFVTTDNIGFPQCIPYEGNEHLLGTTNVCDDFYKTWK